MMSLRILAVSILTFSNVVSFGATLPIVKDIEAQPFVAQTKRLIEATDYLGVPFTVEDKKKIETAIERSDVEGIQSVLDAYCLFGVQINPEMRVKVAPGPAKAQLVEQGWRQFLVKVAKDRKSTRLNSSHSQISYAVFCLKKKKK